MLVELVYLIERSRLDPESVERIFALVGPPGGSYEFVPLDPDVAVTLRAVPRVLIPDMPDRIIVATARHLGLPLITRDAAIHRSGVVPVIW